MPGYSTRTEAFLSLLEIYKSFENLDQLNISIFPGFIAKKRGSRFGISDEGA